MGRSILNVGLSVKKPFVKATMPLSYAQNGMPFLYDTFIDAIDWHLVSEDGTEYPLDITYLTFINDQIYYNGDKDLFGYLENLGYKLASGSYYYKIHFAGEYRYSQYFKIGLFGISEPPITEREHSDEYSLEYS